MQDVHGDRAAITGTLVRWVAAAATAVGGLVHLQLYFDGYRSFPNANLGRSFLLNAIASMAVAPALVVRRDAVVRLAAVPVLVGTLVAFFLSRSDRGVFGFTESGLNPSPQAVLTLVAEIAGLVLIAATFWPAVGAGHNLETRAAAGTAAAALVVTFAAGALWARTPSVPEAEDVPTRTIVPTTTAADTTTTTALAAGPTSVGATTAAATTNAAISTTSTAPTTVAGGTTGAMTVSIDDFAFDPVTLDVAVGTTVEWVNNDSTDHSVLADDGSFHSEVLKPGDHFTFQFTAAGTFAYGCGIHPSMTASITVTG